MFQSPSLPTFQGPRRTRRRRPEPGPAAQELQPEPFAGPRSEVEGRTLQMQPRRVRTHQQDVTAFVLFLPKFFTSYGVHKAPSFPPSRDHDGRGGGDQNRGHSQDRAHAAEDRPGEVSGIRWLALSQGIERVDAEVSDAGVVKCMP